MTILTKAAMVMHDQGKPIKTHRVVVAQRRYANKKMTVSNSKIL